jgi:hypothetical protein
MDDGNGSFSSQAVQHRALDVARLPVGMSRRPVRPYLLNRRLPRYATFQSVELLRVPLSKGWKRRPYRQRLLKPAELFPSSLFRFGQAMKQESATILEVTNHAT